MTQHASFLLAFSAVLTLTSTSCQGSPNFDRADRDGGKDGSGGTVSSPRTSALERCEGGFACTIYLNGEVVETQKGDLVRRGEDCLWRDPEGTPTVDLSGPGVTLYDDYFSFDGMYDGFAVYVECLPLDNTASSTASGSCSGTATSCSSMSFLDCTSQSGCHSSIGDAYTTSDDRCTGSSESCDEFDGQADCEHQRGCHWTD